MDISKCSAYELVEQRNVSDINSVSYLLKHKKTGARVLVLENDDENKVFSIGFRTPPNDSTGVAHILEHSVLCGSKNYPSKDPFVELAKGSLNTFLNAMTYPDKTVYPVASCNDKDFRNLMSVYLDAVFYPNIYTKEEIFKQEGWHYELESEEDTLTINGVVYNEMKGVYSSPDDILERKVIDTLFPDTCYGYESGGDPDVIPQLTYEQFLDFHRAYYHPSNSFIYLYGNADMEDTLNFIDSEYLSDFDRRDVDSTIGMQEPFTEAREYYFNYSITENEPTDNNTYLAYNSVIATSLDQKLYVAFQIIEYALLDASGAVLKEALLKKGIGTDILSTYDNGVLQPYFSIISKNANESDKELFLNTIKEVLLNVYEKGFDKKTLLAGINSFEFRYREADFGNYPKGLCYGLQSFDSWLYDGDPIMHIAENDTFEFLKGMVETDYFENLVKEYLIDNTHASIIVLSPVVSLTKENDEKLAKELADKKAHLSEEQIKDLIEQTILLKKYQEEEDSEEVLAKLPMLSIDDLDKSSMPFINDCIVSEGVKILRHNIFTNGIAYIKLLFNLNTITKEDLRYVGILKGMIGLLDTKNYSYAELSSEIDLNSGGIFASTDVFVSAVDTDKYDYVFEIKARVLYDKIEFAFKMFKELLFGTKIEDNVRLKELMLMLKSRLEGTLLSSGHVYASSRTMSGVSEVGALTEYMNGISFYRFVDSIVSDFDDNVDMFKAKLISCLEKILTKNNFVLADITATDAVYDCFTKLCVDFYNDLSDLKEEIQQYSLKTDKINEGFKTAGKVQYVAKGGNFIDDEHPYTGCLRVLKVIMGYDYLWSNVRVMGGAYGCFATFSKFGDAYFVSYRDPNLKGTLDIYDKSADYFAKFKADDRTMTKYIIGTISGVDAPLSPSAKGLRSLCAYMIGESFENVQKERTQILSTTDEDIRKLSSYIEKALCDAAICVIGGEEAIENAKDIFANIENLIS